VKIKVRCTRDGRDVMAEQVVAGGGECPWDGEPFEADYAITLVNALREAEEAGSRLEQALEQIADVNPAFTIDAASVLGALQASIDRTGRNLVRRG
jgi:hypothetical protein